MLKQRLHILLHVLILATGSAFAGGCAGDIPEQAGAWRVEVGEPGNEFYDASASAPEKSGKSSYNKKYDKPPRDQKKFEKLLSATLGEYRQRFNFENQIKKLGREPKNADGSFRYVAMGDSRSNWELWSNIVKHIDKLDPKPAFVIHTGDIVQGGYAEELRDYYVQAVLQTDIPFFVAIGNHDDSSDSKAREYRYLFGDNSLNYYFDYGDVRFVFVDNVTKVQSFEKTLKWLDKTLAETPKGYRKYVSAHKPPKTVEKWAYHAWGSDESKVFTDLMRKHKVNEVYLGHIHAYSTARHKGVDYTLCGGGGAPLHGRYGPLGSVHHYIICDVRPDGSVKQQVVRFYKPED